MAEQPIRVVAITGAPGVGKTEVARRLVERYRVPAAVADTDGLAGVCPWAVDERLYRLIARNLRACLDGYREWGARVVVLSGVLMVDGTLAHLGDLLDDPRLDWVFYGLRARPEQLTARIRGDAKYQDADGRLEWLHLNDEVTAIPGVRLVDTTHLGLDQVVDTIAAWELAGSEPVPPPAPVPVEVVDLPLAEVARHARRALSRCRVPAPLAGEVVADLLDAELDGCPSHGLQRIPEYAAAITAGSVRPDAEPLVRPTGPGTALVDGRGALGVTVRRVVVDTLCGLADRHRFAIVGLRGSAHLGRLRSIADAVTARGLVLLGFVNCGGAGQKVAPPGGVRGRLATNPMVLACPAPPGPPVIVDTSTSATSEGAVRVAALYGRTLADGLLVDRDGRAVRDPGALYTTPPAAAIVPLGGIAAHRGYALAVGVELLAGIVAGAGFSDVDQPPFSNGGLFVAFPAEALGRSLAGIGADITRLERHLAGCPTAGEGPAPRLPGRRPARAAPESVRLPASLWTRIRELSDGRPVRSLV